MHIPRVMARNLRWRPAKRVVLFAVALVACVVLALLAAAEYRPAWYVPINLTDEQLKAVRMNATRLVDDIGDRLAVRESYELVLSAQQVNEWLAGMSGIWPEAARRIPRELVEPVVAFTDGGWKIASRLESKGWRAIVSMDGSIKMADDAKYVTVETNSLRFGALPVPRWLLARVVESIQLGETGASLSGRTADGAFESGD
jgi:hypothetical protein